LTGYVGKGHLARAALEATVWQVKDVADAMTADCGMLRTALKVDGGMTASDLLMQFQADLLDVPVGPAYRRREHLPGRGLRGGLRRRCFWSDVDELSAHLASRPALVTADDIATAGA
jgi:glycerol kinase